MNSIKSLAINCLIIALLWIGLVEGVDGARNLGLFVVWVSIVLSFFVLVFDDVRNELVKKGASVPRSISVPTDFFIIGILAWTGYAVTAAFFFFAWAIVYSALHHKEAKADVPQV